MRAPAVALRYAVDDVSGLLHTPLEGRRDRCMMRDRRVEAGVPVIH